MTTDNEDEARRRLKRIMPPIALGLSAATFVIFLMAGYGGETSLLVAGLMMLFVLLTWGMRVLLGPSGIIVAMGALGLIGWRLQASGLL